MGKFWQTLTGKDEDEDENDEYEDDDTSMSTEDDGDSSAPASFGSNAASALELKVVRPESYDAVTQIADHLLSNRTVVLNLEATSKETSRRLIDFLSGVAYSINGNLKRVAQNTFVITPCNVDVSGEPVNEPPKAQPAAAPKSDIFDF